jgi:hypothetical protein
VGVSEWEIGKETECVSQCVSECVSEWSSAWASLVRA